MLGCRVTSRQGEDGRWHVTPEMLLTPPLHGGDVEDDDCKVVRLLNTLSTFFPSSDKDSVRMPETSTHRTGVSFQEVLQYLHAKVYPETHHEERDGAMSFLMLTDKPLRGTTAMDAISSQFGDLRLRY